MIVLSAASLYVVGKGAEDEPEPYVIVRRSDALLQIGAAMVLMFVWVQLAAAVVLAITKQRISAGWLSVLLWALICEFYLFHSPVGYIEDVARLVA